MGTSGSSRRSVGGRFAAWCAAGDAPLTCGAGPLARYLYYVRLLARGTIRLGRLLVARARANQR